MAEKASLADRRANALQGEMEEARSLLDSAERGKKQTEAELAESRSAVNEMSSINSRASSDKRSAEGAVHTMHAEIDDLLVKAKGSEEKAKKAMVDAARLADELRVEQDHTNNLSKQKRALETQLSEMETKYAEASENAVRGGRMAMAKLETRIREWRESLAMCSLTPGRTARLTRSLSAKARKSSLPSTKTTRTRSRCQFWPASCSQRSRPTRSRSRRPRRSPLSTWPSSGRPSRSWRRWRKGPGSLRPRPVFRDPQNILDNDLEDSRIAAPSVHCVYTILSQ